MDTTTDKYPDVTDSQKDICARFGHLLTNTGGNDPVDLLQDMQRPGTDARPNRLASTNVVRFTLAVGVQSQVWLLQRLEREGLLTASICGDHDRPMPCLECK